jgi:hypothetical protein
VALTVSPTRFQEISIKIPSFLYLILGHRIVSGFVAVVLGGDDGHTPEVRSAMEGRTAGEPFLKLIMNNYRSLIKNKGS